MKCRGSYQKALHKRGAEGDQRGWGVQTKCGKILPGDSDKLTYSNDQVTCAQCLSGLIDRLQIQLSRLSEKLSSISDLRN